MARAVGKSFFTRGEGTLSIPYLMHRRHREKLVAHLQAVHPALGKGCLVLKGGEEQPVYDTDTTWDFKQESNFQYLFGAKEPGLRGAVDLASGTSYLFIPRLPELYAQWYGPIKGTQWFCDEYEVDHVFYDDEMQAALQKATDHLVLLDGTNHDSGSKTVDSALEWMTEANFPGGVTRSRDVFDALVECRVIKCDTELEIMQFTNDVSSKAHIITMREAQRKDRRMEYQSEAEFKYQSFIRGCSRVGYSCICPASERNATLHYGHCAEPNEHEAKEGDMKLHDMGAEYHCYTADITCSFPIGGKFTPQQRTVYEAVWAAVVAVEEAVRPGVHFVDLHRLAQRVMLEKMTAAGLFKGDIDAMVAADLMAYFMPTGLGHQLGLDVHDVGGYEPGKGKGLLKELTPPVTQNLRLARPMAERMVFTVEPGFYFNAWLLEKLHKNEKALAFVDAAKLDEFRPVGGVRIEDNVVVTADGCRVLSDVPRTVEEIEAVIAGAEWTHGNYRVYKAKN